MTGDTGEEPLQAFGWLGRKLRTRHLRIEGGGGIASSLDPSFLDEFGAEPITGHVFYPTSIEDILRVKQSPANA